MRETPSTTRHPAAGGGRWVQVSPERLPGWLAAFGDRHGVVEWAAAPDRVVVSAADGARAECRVPFPPLRGAPGAAYGGLPQHVAADRTVGVLLVRLGGHAAGIFVGPHLTASKVGTRPVHARSAAGGWSQQRFARRRENQSQAAWTAAAGVAAGILLPALASLDGLVLGGDRRSVDAVLADPRLLGLSRLATGSLLDVPDPRQQVLVDSYALFRAVHIRVVDPPLPVSRARCG